MKKLLLICGLITVSILSVYAQVEFEKGYFIDESNQRIECLIRNLDWRNNPTKFDYKLSMETPVQEASIVTVREFGIVGVSKYVRNTVGIDRSSIEINSLSGKRNPEFQEEQLFLKVLVEGEASLFMYLDGNLTRFFYRTNDSVAKQLIYKQFWADGSIGHNNSFRQQLFDLLRCPSILMKDIEDINYRKKDLEQFFVKLNECVNSEYVTYEPPKSQKAFNLSVRPGVNYSNLFVENKTIPKEYDFGNQFNFRIGIEAEFGLPLNGNKWSFIIEPTYQHYKSHLTEKTVNTFVWEKESIVDYKSIELPMGIRYYFFLNDDSKLYANAAYILDFSFNSTMKFSISEYSEVYESLDYKSRRSLALGVGYKYLDKFSMEVRYNMGREILGDYLYWNSSYKTLSVIFGYSIFQQGFHRNQ
jgi:hypothetical protein